MYGLVILFTLMGSVIPGFLGSKLGRGSWYISLGCISMTAITGIIGWLEIVMGEGEILLEYGEWITGVSTYKQIFDTSTASMVLLVGTISTMVHIFSINYIETYQLTRFISLLSAFTFSMLLLITSGDYLLLLTGWEYIGLASFLLISFWYTRVATIKAAMHALVFNKIGDLGVIMALGLIFNIGGEYEMQIAPLGSNQTMQLVIWFALLGLVGKSAQFGFNTWLTLAMEGPTPVSALIHSSTLVTAGIYLMYRLENYQSINILPIIGTLTVIVAGISALFHNDIKKIIALSTCSQLGYIVLAPFNYSLFHLLIHGFFKALLFICAGVIIHTLSGQQDIRKMGGLARLLPLTSLSLFIGTLSITGFPCVSGFYSKEPIIHGQVLLIAGAVATIFYSFKLWYWVFIGNPRGFKHHFHDTYEFNFLLPFLYLGTASILFGYLFKDLYIGFGSYSCFYLLPTFDFEFEMLAISPLLALGLYLLGTPRWNTEFLVEWSEFKLLIHLIAFNNFMFANLVYLFSSAWLNFSYSSLIYAESGLLQYLIALGLTRSPLHLSVSLDIVSSRTSIFFAFWFSGLYYLLLLY